MINECTSRRKRTSTGIRSRLPKLRHPTKEAADEYVAWMTEKYKMEFQSYHCNQCNHWHVGRPMNPNRGWGGLNGRPYTRLQQALHAELGPRAYIHLGNDNLKKITHLLQVAERKRSSPG